VSPGIVRVSILGAHIDINALDKQMRAVSRALAEQAKKDLEKVVRNWDHKPAIVVWGPARRGMHLTTTVGPAKNDENWQIFQWVDQGTKSAGKVWVKGRRGFGPPSMPIRPGKGTGGDAVTRTSPGSLVSGGKGGGEIEDPFFVKSFIHKGIEARDFTGTIAMKFNRGGPGSPREQITKGLGAVFMMQKKKSRLRSYYPSRYG